MFPHMHARTQKKKARADRPDRAVFPRFVYLLFRRAAKGYICMEILPDVPLERWRVQIRCPRFAPEKKIKVFTWRNINCDWKKGNERNNGIVAPRRISRCSEYIRPFLSDFFLRQRLRVSFLWFSCSFSLSLLLFLAYSLFLSLWFRRS